MADVKEQLLKVKEAGRALVAVENEKVKSVLGALAEEIMKEKDFILAENQKDLATMEKEDPKYDRLLLTEERLQGIADSLKDVADLESPVGRVLEERTLPNGLHLKKVSVPIGVIGVIYEARPNVTVDVFALCLKAGNASVLKGGSDAQYSSAALMKVIQDTLQKNGLPRDVTFLMPPERETAKVLLEAHDAVDVIIPRGGQGLIDWVRQNAKVPVIETGAGIVHTFFDETGDLEKGKAIILNAKTRRPAVCNALDTLIVHEKRLNDLPQLVGPLAEKGVKIFADEEAMNALKGSYPDELLEPATPEHFGTEFLSLKMSIKTVKNLDEALEHINRYSSKHSEAIISADEQNIQKFLNLVDAACVYANTSTAFTDGGQFGMGAEIGISTQKLHARGPMALKELTSYKWIVVGDGQTRADS